MNGSGGGGRRGSGALVLCGWGWRAAPGWMVYTAALLVAGAITSVLYPVGLALVIDAALRHSRGRRGPRRDRHRRSCTR